MKKINLRQKNFFVDSRKSEQFHPIQIPDLKEQLGIQENLLRFQNRFNLIIEQKNGQRILRSASLRENPLPPGPKCEIFVAKVPKDIYEDVIYPIFSRVGKIYEIRLMMSFSGLNRGYCFIMYDSPRAAQRAIKELDQFEICPGHPIGVVKSINHCRLRLEGFSKNIDTLTLVEVSQGFSSINRVENDLFFYNYRNCLKSAKRLTIFWSTHRTEAPVSSAPSLRSTLIEMQRWLEDVCCQGKSI